MAIHMATFKTREDWLEHRTRIGGSEVAALVGMNPWMTNVDLFQIKTGRKKRADLGEAG